MEQIAVEVDSTGYSIIHALRLRRMTIGREELVKLSPQPREVGGRHQVRDGPGFPQAAAQATGSAVVSAEILKENIPDAAAHQLVAWHLLE